MCQLFQLTLLILIVCEARAKINPNVEEVSKDSARQKRLLFYDEDGNLVKTYKNPYFTDAVQNAEKVPFFGNIFNPFLSFLRPTFGGPVAYMIPVSDEVIQQINSDPVYQNKLFTLPRKELVVAPNPQCEGKRSQIPAGDCRNFVNCWDGWAFEQECPEGLLFAKEGYCDYPQNVDCSNRSNAPTVMPSRCSKDFETYRDEIQCNEFFVCANSVPVKFKCPADLAYNTELGVCDYRNRVDCSSGSTAMKDQEQSKGSTNTCSSPSSEQSSIGQISTVAPKDPDSSPPPAPGILAPDVSAPIAPASDVKTPGPSNSIYNTHSWLTTQLAMSRQEAIRKLKLGSITTTAAAA